MVFFPSRDRQFHQLDDSFRIFYSVPLSISNNYLRRSDKYLDTDIPTLLIYFEQVLESELFLLPIDSEKLKSFVLCFDKIVFGVHHSIYR